MLIACFQCRQQLDVPEDSAGKRVRCPHCQYVIVVPAKARATEEALPVVGLPSMDLDGDVEKTPTTKVSPQSLPPLEPSQSAAEKAEPVSKPQPSDEEEPMPSIERSKRRRTPMSPNPPANVNWGKILGVVGVFGVIVIAVLIGIFSSKGNRGRHVQPPIVFNPPVMQPVPKMQFPKENFPPQLPFPNFQQQPMVNALLWRDYSNLERRFKVQFPGKPNEVKQNINLVAMTTFESMPVGWEFSVAHRTLSEEEYRSILVNQRFTNLQQHLCNIHNAALTREQNLTIAGTQPGREWDLVLPNGNILFVRTYFVEEGKKYHHYLLQARGPFNVLRFHADINRFFNSFAVTLSDGTGQTILEELDDPLIGGRRDNEFTALALHPKELIAVVGSTDSRLNVQRMGPLLNKVENFQFQVRPGFAIEQTAFSNDGQWLTVAAGGRVEFWRNGGDMPPLKKAGVEGNRFAFMKDAHLLVATNIGVDEYALDKPKSIANLTFPAPFVIRGLALASDNNTLAVFGDKAIELWLWREKKLLGRIEAHDAAITAVVFAPDGKTLASASADRTIKLWEVESRTERATLKQHAWTVWALAFTPDGKHLASGGLDGMLLLWNVEPAQPKLVWAQSHQFPVRAVAFDADGKNCFATCKHPAPFANPGGKPYLRQLHKIAFADMKPNEAEAKRIVAQQAGLHLPTSSMMTYLTPDAHTIVTTTDGIDGFRQENSLRVWDAATARLKTTHAMKGHGVLSPDGKWFVFERPADANVLSVLDVQTNRVIADTISIAGGKFPQMMFSADSGSLWVWRPLHGFTRYEIQIPNQGPTRLVEKQKLGRIGNDPRDASVIPALDYKTFLIERVAPDGVLRTRKLYDSANGKEWTLKAAPGDMASIMSVRHRIGLELHDQWTGNSKEFGQQRHPMASAIANNNRNASVYAIDPKQKYVATTEVSNDQTIRVHLWDIQERRPVLTLADPRTRSATALRFSPDGQYLALVTSDSWTRIVPVEWLVERKDLLPCNPNDVTGR